MLPYTLENLSSRATAIIGATGTFTTFSISGVHEILSLLVAISTISVLIPTGIKNWRTLNKKDDDNKK